MSYDKGARGERELLQVFFDEGFVGFRAPSSGSTTNRELPDVLVGNGESIFAFEAKRSGGEYKYIEEYEIADLCYFAESFGAEPYIAVRFDYGDWYFFKAEEMHQTAEGNYRVKEENVDEGRKISDIL